MKQYTTTGTTTAPISELIERPPMQLATWQCPFCKTVYTIMQTACHCQTDYTQIKPPVIVCKEGM